MLKPSHNAAVLFSSTSSKLKQTVEKQIHKKEDIEKILKIFLFLFWFVYGAANIIPKLLCAMHTKIS